MKKIDLYTFIYNDEDFLPFFLDYYSKIVDSMTFIDSGSTDNTLKIIKYYANKIYPVLRVTQTGLTWWDHNELHQIRNEIWKESKANLVLFPDCDEIFYQTGLRLFLEKTKYDIYELEGYEMVAPVFPNYGTSILNIKKGVKAPNYNKSTIFNPKIDITFLNAHLRYTRVTNVSVGDIKLLHYRNLGIRMMQKRSKRESDRLPVNCSYRSRQTDKWIRERHSQLMNESKIVI